MIDEELWSRHRERALSPDRPVLRGTAQNPDVFFQAREAVNPFYDACPASCRAMDRFAELTGRRTTCSTTSAPRTPSASS
jgi:pyruvate-ferredoxin/flavodoxin oxidoreductase